jgi:hypothetical protein
MEKLLPWNSGVGYKEGGGRRQKYKPRAMSDEIADFLIADCGLRIADLTPPVRSEGKNRQQPPCAISREL